VTPTARPTPSRASTARPADTLFVLDRHLTEADRTAALAADVRAGLCARPKELPPKWFYDGEGSRLFEAITELPEYYPTRRERAILRAHADEIAALTRAETLVELGSGTSEKTRLLLDALAARGCLTGIVPFDVDDTVLAAAGAQLAAEYHGVLVHAVVGDFQQHVDLLPTGDRRLIVFLGGTIGNLLPAERHRLLGGLRAGAGPHDALLLGTDLVKDPRRLVAAYDDAAGVTAAFNRNVLAVINRELDGDLDPGAFGHVAVWDADKEWIEMRLQSASDQQARLGALELDVLFERGEQMRTEISAKFRRDGVAAELAGADWEMVRWWTDPAGDFGVSLSVPADL
jgi:L-histidine N-alpha-methyltransferase